MKAYFNLLKIAMPVPPPPQELSENMRQEGLIFLHDLNRQLPALGIKKIKDALKSVGAGVEGIFMPKAYFPTPKHIVDMVEERKKELEEVICCDCGSEHDIGEMNWGSNKYNKKFSTKDNDWVCNQCWDNRAKQWL